jgi:hypothetical protein
VNSRPQLMEPLVGTWATEGKHSMLPGEVIRGRATFEWLDGCHFLIWRSHYDHRAIPDAIAITGVMDSRLSMHYFDSRGVHRVFLVTMTPGTWRFSRDGPDFSQRVTATFSDDGNTITSHGQLSRDGASWEDDLALTYRRIGAGRPAG